MTSFQIKILACLFMAMDHIGYIFFPSDISLRIIGRLSFLIFAFLIAEGYRKTGNIKRYLLRLLVFGLISQPIYFIATKDLELNIFFTLFLGLLSILIFDRSKNRKLGFLLMVAIASFAHFLGSNYGAYGVLSVFFFWFYSKDEKFANLFISQTVLVFFYQFIERLNLVNGSLAINSHYFIQTISLFALFFIYLYNGKRGRKIKYVFYAFYPAHLLILALINYLLK